MSQGWVASIAALVSTIAMTGCYDRREALAYQTLFDSSGFVDERAYSAAISAKFPPGSPVEAVRTYAAANGGDCNERDGKLWCEIAYRGHFCAAAMVGIEVTPVGRDVGSIHTVIGGLSC